MSSSTPSSPVSENSGLDAPVLSPRSKVKALLAAVDDASDFELIEPKSKLVTIASASSSQQSPSKACYIDRGDALYESGQKSSDEDAPIVPRGRIAGKLRGKALEAENSASSDGELRGQTARERLKRRLMSRNKPSKQSTRAEIRTARNENLRAASIISSTSQAEVEGPKNHFQATPSNDERTQSGDLDATPQSSQALSSGEESNASLPKNLQSNNRFQELVAKKRAEGEAREAEEAEKKAKKREMVVQADIFESSDEHNEVEVGVEKRLTQQARPTRKASKKAIEEMNRETQRLNRNRQLAHEAKTKKKISKQSFLERFKHPTFTTSASTAPNLSSSTAPTSAPASDAENAQSRSSPPSSPASTHSFAVKSLLVDQKLGNVESVSSHKTNDCEPTLPTFNKIFTQNGLLEEAREDCFNPSVDCLDLNYAMNSKGKQSKSRTSIRERLAKHPRRTHKQLNESGSDVEIVPVRKSRARLDAFRGQTKVKAGDERPLQTLRALAQLTSSKQRQTPRSNKPSMTLLELQIYLQRKARQQAALERAEKIQQLKEKGIVVQTVEERARDQAEVEDLLEKAQKEAADIKEKEKRAAKKNGTAGEDDDDAILDDDDDDDYKGSQEGQAELDLSGSEEGLNEEDEVEEDEEGTGNADLGRHEALDEGTGLVFEEASEDECDEDDVEAGGDADNEMDEEEDDEDQEDEHIPAPPRRTRTKVVLENEDEDEEDDSIENSLQNPRAVQNPFQPAPANPLKPNAGMLGLTQAFAATMADSQTQNPDDEFPNDPDSLAMLGTLPEPDLPVYDPDMIEDSHLAGNSLQDQHTSNDPEIQLDFTQSQLNREDTQEDPLATQDMDLPDPSQDVGFALSSPARKRFVSPSPSAVDTALLSPAGMPRGRLRRGAPAHSEDSDQDQDDDTLGPDRNDQVPTNAFDVLKKKPPKPKKQQVYDKKKSNAKEMVEEQAQESEDEYAGIGGASDDDSGGENDEEVQKMIDEAEITVDEQQLAALHA